jgi:hypothetical protein
VRKPDDKAVLRKLADDVWSLACRTADYDRRMRLKNLASALHNEASEFRGQTDACSCKSCSVHDSIKYPAV